MASVIVLVQKLKTALVELYTKLHDDGTTMKVAIKLFKNAHVGSDIRKRAENEIGFLEDLEESKHIVTILHTEVKSSSVAIVLELCTMDLTKWMVKNVPENGLDPARVISEFVPFFSRALQQMHEKGIVHLDLHSGNILQCGDVWKVTNFDQAESSVERSVRNDLYSVGDHLRELVTGMYSRFPDTVYRGPLGEFIQKLVKKEINTFEEFEKAKEIVQP